MTSTPVVQYASRTDVGMRRAANQDSLAVRLCSDHEEWSRCGHLFVVADGMGGHAVGDLASRITIETLPHAYFKRQATSVESRLREAIMAANKAINDRGRENREFEGMGTTCSVLSLSERGAFVGHVGDSRVYRIRRGQIEQLTFDHSLQWEMIRLGRATAENVELFHPRNVITRCLGPDPMVQIDVEGPFSVEAGDHFLLCSDGLTNHVTDAEIGQIAGSLPPSESSRLLVNLANCRGGSDNSTVIVVGIDSYPNSAADKLATISESPVLPKTADGLSTHRPGLFKIVMAIIAVLCLIFGVGLGLANKIPAAAVLVIASVVAWLISRRLGTGDELKTFDIGEPDPLAQLSSPAENPDAKTTEPNIADLSSSRSAFLTRSPYRVIRSVLSETMLLNLAEVQSELVQAARDSAWKVDFDELSSLSRQAIQAQQSGKLDRALKPRAKAIDLLMKELYHRSRPG